MMIQPLFASAPRQETRRQSSILGIDTTAALGVGCSFLNFSLLQSSEWPFVIALYVIVVVLWILSFYWISFSGGARDLTSHPGLMNLPVTSPSSIKAYFLLCLAGGIVGLAWMVFGNIQIPLGR